MAVARWYEANLRVALQRATELELLLTQITLRWLAGDDAKIRHMTWHQKVVAARSALPALDEPKRERLATWLLEVDDARLKRNLIAHSTPARYMVGPGEDDSHEHPDLVGLVRDQSGVPTVHNLSRDELAEWIDRFNRACATGASLLASGLKLTQIPPS